MKKLIVAMAVTVFTVGAYAGSACADKAKDQAACADKAKVAASCPASKKDMAQCPAGATAKKDGQKNVARSPKDAANNKS